MFKHPIRIVLVLLLTFLCLPVVADQHSSGGDSISYIKEIYERAVALSPEVLEATEGSIAHPYVKVGKQFIPLNFGFWELVRGWIRLYRSEIQEYCSCNINENELVQEAKDHVAKGFFDSKINGKLFKFKEYLVMEAYSMYTLYGKVAVLLKATSEVVEHTFLGAKGLGFICNAIDVMILFIFRKSQMYMHSFNNSKTVDKNRMLMMFRLAYINRLMKKAQRKVSFYLESTVIDQEALALVDAEGVRRNKRANWVRTLSKKATPILDRIKEIDKELEDETLSKRQRAKLFKAREKLSKKIGRFTEVSKKTFFGKRYKWFLFLLSRKGQKGYLKGTDFSDEIISTTGRSKNWLWPLVIQENILERALVSQAEKNLHRTYKTAPLEKDEIRNSLAAEFVGKLQTNTYQTGHIQAVEQVLTDIEKIFDPSLTTTERYLLVSVMESVFVGFFEHYLRLMHNKLSQSTSGMNIWGRGKLRGKLDRFIYHVFVYSDFLRTVALVKDGTKINSYKYESMENLLLFFEYLNKLHQLTHSKHMMKEKLLDRLDTNLQRIQSFQVHLEKRTAFSWNPFSIPVPYCRSLGRISN